MQVSLDNNFKINFEKCKNKIFEYITTYSVEFSVYIKEKLFFFHF